MHIEPFATENFFAQYEFTTPYLLCASDCESMTLGQLLKLTGESTATLEDVWLGYTHSQGSLVYRELVAGPYDSVSSAEVVALGAPEEGIYTTMRALLEPGDEVVVLTPAYDSLRHLASHIAGTVRSWTVRPTENGWALDLEELPRLMGSRTRLVVVNFPHNPTGLLPSREEFDRIVEIVRDRGVWLFCDEMYRGLEFGVAPQLPSAVDLYDRAIVLSGLSKAYGLPGLRAGWLVVKDASLRQAIINWKHYTTICASAPSEFLAVTALRIADELTARNRALVAENLATASAFFARWPSSFRWRPPQAGSVALLELAVPSATDYCRWLAASAGILLLPGPNLGSDDKHVRLGLGRRDFAANLARYDAHLTDHPLESPIQRGTGQ